MEKPIPETKASRIIDSLGGTGEVARLCDVDPAAVSQWRRNGIPKARLQFIRLARPEVLTQIPNQTEAA
jgi:hypothetical protein